MNGLPCLAKMSIERQPIVPCSFQAEFGGRVEFSLSDALTYADQNLFSDEKILLQPAHN